MKKLFVLPIFLTSVFTASNAQWRDTKHHGVFTALAGGGSTSSENFSSYQLIARGMYYPKRIYAFGGELGYTQGFGQYKNYDAAFFNGFFHLKLPLGFYGEAGLGAMATVSDGRAAEQPGNVGLFWSLGWAKKLGSRFALEAQYRKAPTINSDAMNMMQRNLRFGFSIRL